MKPQTITVAAALAVTTLAGVTVATAITGANGAPARSVLVKRASGARVAVSTPQCSLAGGGGTSAIRVSGVCDGIVTGAFTCVERAKLLGLSIDTPFGRDGQAFHLTIVVSGSAGAGASSEAAAVAQITGLGNVSRWTNRKLTVRIGRNGSVELEQSVLEPEPGTPATGRLTLLGRATCAPK